ncbi:hypothetical protein Y032_0048g1597 [Ancylostoma ceylanicum]|uniref:SCP domain-containing protein n=1 Tax=Ancylostoma ceylanicum TaxID=53326 RepID=A0A016UBW7_9BILA|nr:hypothetical protein Y032_0048g1597 [Ancylostoma ceylanicum]
MQLGCSVIVLTAALLIPNVDGFAVPTNFNCKNSLISDEWRKLVLNFHNGKRRLLAQGKQPSLNLPAPWAKNIGELTLSTCPAPSITLRNEMTSPTKLMAETSIP